MDNRCVRIISLRLDLVITLVFSLPKNPYEDWTSLSQCVFQVGKSATFVMCASITQGKIQTLMRCSFLH